ncbi:MAG: hypothetical protein K2J99_06890 [Lachnospiraceae bacterium]|nr:hypothetical protein [Lachnospiraceae bacterium]
MKLFKRIGITIMLLPFIVIAGIIIYEIVGMCVNHAATDRQTEKLQTDLTEKISDIEIINVNSETGNASGTGNHVESMSTIMFSTGMTEGEIKAVLPEEYNFDRESCVLRREEDGSYSIYLETPAPFPDNIEGH